MKTLEKILTLFITIGAVAGAVMMWIDPTGMRRRTAVGNVASQNALS
jgi:hypothetical protein